MKKVLLILTAVFCVSIVSYGQVEKYLNFGIVGAGLEFPVSEAWTVGLAAFSQP